MKRTVVAASLLAFLPAQVVAHPTGLSHGRYAAREDRVDLELRFSAEEIARTWPEVAPAALAREALAAVSATRGDAACAVEPGASRDEDGAVEVEGAITCPAGTEPVWIRLGFLARLAPGHVHLARVAAGGRVAHDVVDGRRPVLEVNLPAPVWRQAGRFLALGVEHILTGWDHVAFLLGLLLAARSLRQVLKVVTAFTAAHAVTLALAMLGLVSVPPAVVEPLIAASVAFVGWESLRDLRRPPERPRRRWPLAFAFGLVHGFGFAGALQELRLPPAGLAAALVSFNLGVELGQAAIVALAFPLILRLRRPSLTGLRAASVAVGLAGVVWLVQRLPW